MDSSRQEYLKSAMEIGSMAAMLNPQNQSYVMNTINALLYSQQVNGSAPEGDSQEDTA